MISLSSITTAAARSAGADGRVGANPMPARADAAASTASAEGTTAPEISAGARSLAGLFETAGAYVRKEHLEPFKGYDETWKTDRAYLDIGRYNDHLFRKAAATLVGQARELGIELDKDDVLAQLRDDNAEIAALQLDDEDRRNHLGSASVFSHLTPSDLRGLTDLYITAKENGLDVNEVGRIALEKGTMQTYPPGVWGEMDVFPPGWDRSETDPQKIEAARIKPSQEALELVENIRDKMRGDLGLGVDFLKWLFNPRIALPTLPNSTLEFLSKVVDIRNAQS